MNSSVAQILITAFWFSLEPLINYLSLLLHVQCRLSGNVSNQITVHLEISPTEEYCQKRYSEYSVRTVNSEYTLDIIHKWTIGSPKLMTTELASILPFFSPGVGAGQFSTYNLSLSPWVLM